MITPQMSDSGSLFQRSPSNYFEDEQAPDNFLYTNIISAHDGGASFREMLLGRQKEETLSFDTQDDENNKSIQAVEPK
jgi:hypothetical protein